MRFLCGESCVEAFRRGERSQEASPPSPPERLRPTPLPREVEPEIELEPITPAAPHRIARSIEPRTEAPSGSGAPTSSPNRSGFPYVASAMAMIAIVLGLFQKSMVAALVACLFVAIAAAAALHASAPSAKRAGLLVWAAAPVGAVLASLAALLALASGEHAYGAMSGAGLAALSTIVRAWLDGKSRRPVVDAALALTFPIPRKVRIPVRAPNALDVSDEEVPTDRVRAGEELLALKGEVVAVDGVVKAGEAEVLLYPTSRVPVRRTIGDPLLAGARVVDGGLRIMATRVGDDRALFRPARFGHGVGPGSARVARTAEQTTRLGSIIAVTLSVFGLAFEGAGPGLSAQLAAAAAVLLGAPLLAARRAAVSPFVAAGAAAAARGMIFHDARTLETAGSVGSCVLCTHGIVTEGMPEVVEVHPVDRADPR
ncbi:MAG: hypothetical protein H5U40_14680, partial [Polyangiaceae bacterium]|nr:hypothetical protein [Polyangiaceae bacterium]